MKHAYLGVVLVLAVPRLVFAQEIIDITFPLLGEATFEDDFDSPRGNDLHEAIDIMAEQMTPIVAVVDGEISFAPMEEPSYGYMLSLEGDDGYEYSYVHINNDTPGTDDGEGGPENAYAPGIERGVRVVRGQHIAWVGDSGNAEEVGPHLHFEIEDEDDNPINPYESLLAAYAAVTYDPTREITAAVSINADKSIHLASGEVNCESDTLIRTPEVSTVYYCGQDGGRYIFQNEGTFFSWYDDFDDVVFVTTEEMGSIPFKGVVTYKPGTYMLKLQTSPKIYAVAKDGTLRWVSSPDLAETLYGSDWPKMVHDLQDGFFPAYTVGEEVTRN